MGLRPLQICNSSSVVIDFGRTNLTSTQRIRDIEQMLVQCWPDVYDVGPTLTQHWFTVVFSGYRHQILTSIHGHRDERVK